MPLELGGKERDRAALSTALQVGVAGENGVCGFKWVGLGRGKGTANVFSLSEKVHVCTSSLGKI